MTVRGTRLTRCAHAADSGELEVLRWAVQNGCPGGEQYAHHLSSTTNPCLAARGSLVVITCTWNEMVTL
jgi:hypothetical protein